MIEVVTLIKREAGADVSTRDVLATVRSVGMKEFYSAAGTDFHPELTLVLADYLDYEDEPLVRCNLKRYRVVRTYRSGQELELVVERAPVEDGEAIG